MTRAFTRAPVAEEHLEAVVRAAHSGPSAGNTRSLELVVLTDADTEQYWNSTLSPEARPEFPWPKLLNAPVLIIPYVRPAAYTERYAEPDKAHTGLGASETAWPVPYWWVDGGAAVENALLAAHGLELGACFFGQFEHEPAVRAMFGVPDDRRAIGTIAIGHPDVAADRPSQSARRPRRPISATTHNHHWDS